MYCGRGDERERRENRNSIPVHRADEAVDPVVAEAGPPVEVRLERIERGAARGEQQQRRRRHPPPADRSRRGSPCHQVPLADAERNQPDDSGGERKRDGERDESRNDETRSSHRVLERRADEGRPRGELVGNGARTKHDHRARSSPQERPSRHRTRSVNGAVRTLPPTLHCRNSRHVPGCGSKTPTLNLPGVDECPLIRTPPKDPAHAGVRAPHTCVWKYASVPARKKIACASAPNQGVKRAGRPSGPVTVTPSDAAWIARSFGRPCIVIR